MRKIDPNDPFYKGLTKLELARMKNFSAEEKEELSIALFGESLTGPPPWQKQRDRRWAALLGEVPVVGTPYRVTHEDLKDRLAFRARLRGKSPLDNGSEARLSTVSAFSDWVMRLYVPHRSDAALMAGIEGERAVVDRRLQIQRAKIEIPRWEHQRWKLVHDGVRGAFDGAFSIPSLEVGGVAMTGVPDLVFRERKTGRILIVELKVSSAILPSDGWPNLWAQLWAYSRIENWIDAPEVLLAGEIWGPEWPDLRSSRAVLRLRRTYFCRSSDEELQANSKELFEGYGGRVLE